MQTGSLEIRVPQASDSTVGTAENRADINEYIEALKKYGGLSPHLTCHRIFPGKGPEHADISPPLNPILAEALKRRGITSLFSHQAMAIEKIRRGEHIVTATPTASGKTLVYNIPVIESILGDMESRSLYLFPLKALARDQLRGLRSLFSSLDPGFPLTAEAYDGDTSSYKRGRIRKKPPHIVLTNPEMLHLSILPYHDRWQTFIKNLKYVVIDEIHTCRGVMGSHMAWVFKRLLRICHLYKASPVFIFCSATIGNPGELAGNLTGLDVTEVKNSGAPSPKKHFLMLNALEAAAQSAILLLHAALHRNLRTIIYTQSRKMTELISIWAQERSGRFSEKISAYRAGFLPEERREIEARLSSGELLAVVSTSALELGIDIGELDLCILVGYPGSVMATWQRAGRVGRRARESATILIGHEDALDQYIMHNPDLFLEMPPEKAVINPFNRVIMKKHLESAAADHPISIDEPFAQHGEVARALSLLEFKGTLLRSEEGRTYYSSRKYPQRRVHLRGTGKTMDIINLDDGEVIGRIDSFRAIHEVYPGAVYIHRGINFIIQELSIENGRALASEKTVHYFTRAASSKTTEILEITDRKRVWSTLASFGRLRVTELVTGYDKRLIKKKRFLERVPLKLPPVVFETEGFWIEIPEKIQIEIEASQVHFMGGIHAMEHAAIGILPLIVLADRNDLGGISIPLHPQLGRGAVFVYDGIPGGAGLTGQAFKKIETVMKRTFSVIENCKCPSGCPACVHSPKCGSGNRPIDKYAALLLLQKIKEGRPTEMKPPKLIPFAATHTATSSPATEAAVQCRPPEHEKKLHFGVLDLETRRSADEVGGWGKAHKMGISCAVLYDSLKDDYIEYTEDQIPGLLDHLRTLDLVVGFNILRFDYAVLNGVLPFAYSSLPTLDILRDIHKRLGYRLSLDHLGEHSLGIRKNGDGLTALRWWKEGKLGKILEYCRQDVKVTRELYLFGMKKGFLLFRNKAGKKVRIPVNWTGNGGQAGFS